METKYLLKASAFSSAEVISWSLRNIMSGKKQAVVLALKNLQNCFGFSFTTFPNFAKYSRFLDFI